MGKIIICIFSFFIFISCSESKVNRLDSGNHIFIDPDKTQEEIDLSVYFDELVEVIPLETNEECLLSTIKKIQLVDDKIFLSDAVTPGVFVFDMNGKFLTKIGQQGAGPQEFVYMGDFNVADNILYIQDMYGRKYLMIDLLHNETTEFHYDTHHLEMVPLHHDLFFISNYFLSDRGSYNLYRFNLEKGYIDSCLPFDKTFAENNLAWGLSRYSGKYKDEVLLIYPRNDTIYEISNDVVGPRYVIQYGKHAIPEALRTMSGNEVIRRSYDMGYITGLRYIQHHADKIWATYTEGHHYRYMMIDKHTLEPTVSQKIIVSQLGGLSLYNYLITDNDEFISYYEAEGLKNNWNNVYREKFKFDVNSDKVKNIEALDTIEDGDNPVILKFRFRREK